MVMASKPKFYRQIADFDAFFTEGFSGFVTSTTASIVTGWNEPTPGRNFHPLWTSAFSRRTADNIGINPTRAVHRSD